MIAFKGRGFYVIALVFRHVLKETSNIAPSASNDGVAPPLISVVGKERQFERGICVRGMTGHKDVFASVVRGTRNALSASGRLARASST